MTSEARKENVRDEVFPFPTCVIRARLAVNGVDGEGNHP